jgi:hypothetical protein
MSLSSRSRTERPGIFSERAKQTRSDGITYCPVILSAKWILSCPDRHQNGRIPFFLKPAVADVNVAWLSKVLSAARVVKPGQSERRARAIFAAVAGAQLVARSRSDISLFDELIDSYRMAGLLPG